MNTHTKMDIVVILLVVVVVVVVEVVFLQHISVSVVHKAALYQLAVYQSSSTSESVNRSPPSLRRNDSINSGFKFVNRLGICYL